MKHKTNRSKTSISALARRDMYTKFESEQFESAWNDVLRDWNVCGSWNGFSNDLINGVFFKQNMLKFPTFPNDTIALSSIISDKTDSSPSHGDLATYYSFMSTKNFRWESGPLENKPRCAVKVIPSSSALSCYCQTWAAEIPWLLARIVPSFQVTKPKFNQEYLLTILDRRCTILLSTC